jgi:phosphatidylglycerophosphate synthase
VAYTVQEVRKIAKREAFRAGPRMRFVMPRISVPVSTWILNHAPAVTPNQVTVLSGLLGIAAGVFLLFPGGVVPAVAAFLTYQLHILTDYVDGELARVKEMTSPRGAYYDLMVGRFTKPVVLYSAAIGAWIAHKQAPGAELDLIFGALMIAGFFLDKEAVDVWYRANPGRDDIEDPYVVQSDKALRGAPRLLARIAVGVRGIQAFLVYQIIAALIVAMGVEQFVVFGYEATPRILIVVAYGVAFPIFAILRVAYIARTGHIPRRQDLVKQG